MEFDAILLSAGAPPNRIGSSLPLSQSLPLTLLAMRFKRFVQSKVDVQGRERTQQDDETSVRLCTIGARTFEHSPSRDSVLVAKLRFSEAIMVESCIFRNNGHSIRLSDFFAVRDVALCLFKSRHAHFALPLIESFNVSKPVKMEVGAMCGACTATSTRVGKSL
jgi:hypothetical protein